ncbi:N-acetyllactosaminide beta-1,3-N-acetylglucosaminyltransferase [Gryllus bimaculatus]|nr:N-acetyllactosaminide beta-1,3-N-acetylglucosaminyltransferase [Gryllus bimaculatus]
MQHFLWGKVVLVLVAVVAILQVVHLVLLSRLESRHHRHDEQTDPVSSSGNEVDAAFAILARNLHQGRVLDASGEYQVVPNLALGTRMPAVRSLGALPDVTLATQCSYNHLYSIVPLVQRWQGPISVAVFAEEHDLSEALWAIVGLRLCHTEVRQNVSFQLVSPLLAGGHPPLTAPPDSTSPCHLKRTQRPDQHNYAGSHSFPNNLLRNVARRGVATEFVLVVDVDMLPSANLRQDFYNFAVKSRLFSESRREDKTVYVVPAFEVRENVPAPRIKAELLQLADKGDLRPFYIELCWKCQKEPPSSGLSPLFEVLWKDPWEPFYIARNSVPFYDERFKQYGFNRISQVCELHVAGYKFSVLNNGFLVHRGLKTTSSFHLNKDLDQERNRLLFRQFKVELREKYPESSRRCY